MVTIKKLRDSHDYSIRALADELEVNKNTIVEWEKNIHIISGSNLLKVAQLFNVSTDDLLNHEMKV